MNYDLSLLKKVLSIPTKTYQEDYMIEFLTSWLDENNLKYEIDINRNIYVTKIQENVSLENFYFPCVVAHMDTVHFLENINIKEEYLENAQRELKLSLKAYNDEGNPTGIGGDDKAGIFACLCLLKEIPNIKAAFFVAEETGCHGSLNSDDFFFENVGYVIEFDAPENWMITENCYGNQLFDRKSDFFNICDSVLTEGMNKNDMEYMTHPYTDVYALKGKYEFSCINFSIGYYDYHTKNEYVVIEDVFNGTEMGKKMIEKLGNNFYYKKNIKPYYLTNRYFI